MNKQREGKLVVLVAPSGAGKTTIAQKMLTEFDKLRFSTSATTRQPRDGEKDGVDYFYLSNETFDAKIKANEFLEWETVYDNIRYGTLRAQVDKMIGNGYFPLLDIEVKGASTIKNIYGDKCVAIFIRPPSLQVLKERLTKRGTETKQSLQKRIERAEKELTYANSFDYTVVNDDLDHACKQVKTILQTFITSN